MADGTGGLASNFQLPTLNYANAPVTINPATLTVTANSAVKTYGQANPPLSGTVTGFVFSDTLTNTTAGSETFSTTATNASNVGSYSVIGSGLTLNNGNYVFSQATGNATALTINPATLTVTANSAAKTYGQANPTLSGNVAGFVLTDTLANTTTGTETFSTTATNTSNVGSYVVTGSGLTLNNGNYVFSQATGNTSALTINALPVSIAAISGATQVYNGTQNAATSLLTITNKLTGDTVTLSGNATLASKNVGNEAFTLAGLTLNNSNYTLTGGTPSGTVAITPLPVSVATVNGATRVYNGATNAAPNLLTITNVVTGDTVTLSGNATLAGSGVGNQAISLTGLSLSNPNYTLTGGTPSGTVAISPLPVSVATAAGATRVYNGTTNAAANFLTITNVVTGDTVTLSGNATLAGSGVGNEAISLTGLSLSNPNYTLTGGTPSGTVAITPIPVLVTAANGGIKIYDGTTNAASNLLTITNLITGDSVTLSGNATLGGSGTGNQSISLNGLSLNNPNYTLTGGATNGSLTVAARPVSVATLSDANKVYDSTNNAAANLLTITNVVTGDAVTLSGNATLAGSNVGSEALTGLGSLTVNNPNYTVTGGLTGGAVVITPQASVMANATLQVQTTSTAPAQTSTPAATITLASPTSSSGGQTGSAFVNVVAPLPQLSAVFGGGTQLAIISAPSGNEPTQVVSLSQARSMLQPTNTVGDIPAGSQTGDVVGDVRVPVSRNSLAEIVNGGVRLPTGVEQELFVVKAQ